MLTIYSTLDKEKGNRELTKGQLGNRGKSNQQSTIVQRMEDGAHATKSLQIGGRGPIVTPNTPTNLAKGNQGPLVSPGKPIATPITPTNPTKGNQGPLVPPGKPAAMELWEARGFAHRASTTTKHQSTQERFIPLLDLPIEERHQEFMKQTADVSATSRGAYWGALLGAMKAIGMQPQSQDKAFTKIVRKESQKSIVVSNIQPAWPFHVEGACDLLKTRGDLEAILFLKTTYFLAQRPSDTAKILTKNVCMVDGYVSIHFVEGKVIPQIGPYALHLKAELPWVKQLFVFANSKPQGKQLWSQDVEKRVLSVLKAVDKTLEIRSLRRGALSSYARMGMQEEGLMHLSKHKTREMLHRYLNFGMYNIPMATATTVYQQRLMRD